MNLTVINHEAFSKKVFVKMKKPDRISLIEEFADTLEEISTNEELKSNMEKSVEESEVYDKNNIALPEDFYTRTDLKDKFVKFFPYTSLTTALLCVNKRKKNQKICVLNFASGTTPGGGVKNGSSLQEESICRETTLYPVIANPKFSESFYAKNKRAGRVYTDTCIYSPGINIIKNGVDRNALYYEKLDYRNVPMIDVMSCAAPNLRNKSGFNKYNENDSTEAVNLTDSEKEAIIRRRIKFILEVAEVNGVTDFVVGAFGCGAFQNPPEMVAKAFYDFYTTGDFSFRLIFAMFEKEASRPKFKTFHDAFTHDISKQFEEAYEGFAKTLNITGLCSF